jgi:hypothetical protein
MDLRERIKTIVQDCEHLAKEVRMSADERRAWSFMARDLRDALAADDEDVVRGEIDRLEFTGSCVLTISTKDMPLKWEAGDHVEIRRVK